MHGLQNVKLRKDDYEETKAKTTLVSRNITISGRRTSVRLEPEMWTALREIAKRENCTIHDICTLISMRKNGRTSLTAAIRVFLMLYFRASSTEEGHRRAGHGNFDQMIARARLPKSPVLDQPIKIPAKIMSPKPMNGNHQAQAF